MEKAYDHVTKPVVYNKRDSLIDQMIIRGLITNINWITEKKKTTNNNKNKLNKNQPKPPPQNKILTRKQEDMDYHILDRLLHKLDCTCFLGRSKMAPRWRRDTAL